MLQAPATKAYTLPLGRGCGCIEVLRDAFAHDLYSLLWCEDIPAEQPAQHGRRGDVLST